MGLDIHPGDACWSYSGFNDFRRHLASDEGFDLDEMDGFGGLHGVTPGTRSWDEIKSPLVPLLNHSDCDGYLNRTDCEEMLPRLREIADQWDTLIFGRPDIKYDVDQLRKLIDGMEHSVTFGCAVVFG